MSDAPKVETKVLAATGGSLTGGVVAGTLIVWLVHRYTGLDLTPEQGALVATAIGTAATGAFGYFKRSRTAASSEDYNHRYAQTVHREVTGQSDKRIGGTAGVSGLGLVVTVLVIVVLVIVIFNMMGGDVDATTLGYLL
jgi:hypothetical protein